MALNQMPAMPVMDAAIFIDKDGTLIDDVPYNVDPDLIKLVPRAGEALAWLRQLGFRLFIITNQPGVARGYFPESALGIVQTRIDELLSAHDVAIDGFYYCPHCPHTAVACQCRKPLPGMLLGAAHQHGIDLAGSWMIGDILHDVEAGHRAGCRAVLIDNGNETEWDYSPLREADHIVENIYDAARVIAQASASATHHSMERLPP